ncbi:flagellar protein FlaG [Pseudomonas sp. TE3786]
MDVSNITSVAGLPKTSEAVAPVVSATKPADKSGKANDTAKATEKALSSGDLNSVVSDINSYAQTVQRGLSFNVDDKSGDVVVKVIDTDSGKVIRQIPSEELLKLAEQLEDIRSLMFEAKA